MQRELTIPDDTPERMRQQVEAVFELLCSDVYDGYKVEAGFSSVFNILEFKVWRRCAPEEQQPASFIEFDEATLRYRPVGYLGAGGGWLGPDLPQVQR